ncbi:MAG: tetratricopeptide repeat protein [Crocinitomicaceae bacterium]|nr:tetratricopeptide repeat protein [Crocinitomicaceae bacterium]
MSTITCFAKKNSLRISLVFFVVFISGVAFSQTETIDDLRKSLATAKEDTGMVTLLNDLCWEFGPIDLDSSVLYGKRALALVKTLNYPAGGVFTGRYIARAYTANGEYDIALKYLKTAFITASNGEDKSVLAWVYNDLGSNYQSIGSFDEGLSHFYKALDLFEELDDRRSAGAVRVNMSYIFFYLDDYQEVLKLAIEAEKDFKSIDNPVYTAITYNLQGEAYQQLHQFEKSIHYHNLALKIYIEHEDPYRQAEALNSLGTLYQEMGDLDQSLDYYKRSLVIDDSLGNEANVAISYSNIAGLYAELGDIEMSTEYFDKSMILAQKSGKLEMLMTTFKYASEAYYLEGNYKKAYDYRISYEQIWDSIFSEKKNAQIVEIREKYDSEKREQQIVSMQNENAATNTRTNLNYTILGASIGALLLILIIVFLYFSQRKLKEQQLRNVLEQKALRSQMNPHFIFNSLNSIQRLYIEGKEDLANDYMADFSSLLRRILENSGLDKINLKEEIRSTELYLDLEKMRTDNLFEYSIDIDPTIDQLNTYVPPLIFQPFVENSIWHGIVPKNAPGTINIRIRKTASGELDCTISDDGIGISESKRQKVSDTKKSKGISITAARLGGENPITITELDSGGTEIKLRINKAL